MSRLSFIGLVALVLLSSPRLAPAAPLLCVSSYFDGTIKTVAADGTVTTFAAGLNAAYGLAFDASGSLYVAIGSNTIDRITLGGTQSTFATLPSGYDPQGLAFDSSGNLYVSNGYSPGIITKITPSGIQSTFAAGQGLAQPWDLAFDRSGNLYASNYGNATISKITPGGSVSTFATLPSSYGPTGLAFDSAGDLYVGGNDGGVAPYGTIDEISPGGTVTTFLSGGVLYPTGLAFDSSDGMYAANWSGTIYTITPGGTVRTLASAGGTGRGDMAMVVAPSPEPSSIVLLASAAGLLMLRRPRWAGR
jgi:DNA-binding beta-propeller fold protein YncE